MKVELTKTYIDKVPRPEKGCVIHWDQETSGFGLRVSSSGKRTFTAFKVELLGVDSVVIMEDGGTIEGLWAQTLAQMNVLRGMVGPPVLPPSDFQPYATITAVDRADVVRALVVRNSRMVGDGHPDHDERVSALCRAADLVGLGGMSPPAGMERH